MRNAELVVIVSEDPLVIRSLTRTFESEGAVVLALEDGAELRDYVQLLIEQPHRRIEPRVIVVDAQVPGPDVQGTAVWARHHGFEFPIVVFREATASVNGHSGYDLEGVSS